MDVPAPRAGKVWAGTASRTVSRALIGWKSEVRKSAHYKTENAQQKQLNLTSIHSGTKDIVQRIIQRYVLDNDANNKSACLVLLTE